MTYSRPASPPPPITTTCRACQQSFTFPATFPPTRAEPHVCRASRPRRAYVFLQDWWDAVLYVAWKLRTRTSEAEAQQAVDDLVGRLPLSICSGCDGAAVVEDPKEQP